VWVRVGEYVCVRARGRALLHVTICACPCVSQEFGRQHTKQRWSLTKAKQRKLVFVKQHIRMKQKEMIAPWQRPFLDWVHTRWLERKQQEVEEKQEAARRKLAEAQEEAERARAEGDLQTRVAAETEAQLLIEEIDSWFNYEAVSEECD